MLSCDTESSSDEKYIEGFGATHGGDTPRAILGRRYVVRGNGARGGGAVQA